MTLLDQRSAAMASEYRIRQLANWLRSYVGLIPTWRAEYFDRNGGPTASSVFIAAENVSDALEEARTRMAPTCTRAKITRLDGDVTTIIALQRGFDS
jgi:hypothetical protein